MPRSAGNCPVCRMTFFELRSLLDHAGCPGPYFCGVLEGQGPSGGRRLWVRRSSNLDLPIPWEHLQELKSIHLGREALAVEVYPPDCRVVNEEAMRHLWELPADFPVGFQLGPSADAAWWTLPLAGEDPVDEVLARRRGR